MQTAPLISSAAAPPPPPALFDLAAANTGHALIIGDETAELICALIRQGCPGATAIRLGERPHGSAETVLVPHVASPFEAEQAIQAAVRALLPCGEIIIRATGAPADWLVGQIERLLRAHGFSRVRLSVGSDVVVRAELPFYGPLI